MKMTIKAVAAAAILLASGFSAAPARAQASDISVQFAKEVANTCLSGWDTQPCLSAISQSNLVMASNYGAHLKQKGKESEAEQVKQHCAASTAASKGEYPAYAMKSAFTECANTISDIADATGTQPDLGQYELLVSSVLCMTDDRRCAAITEGLRRYQAQ